MPPKVALPPLPNDKADREEANDGVIIQPTQIKRQMRQRLIDAEKKNDTGKIPKIKPVYGTRQGSLLRVGPRWYDLFVFRVDKDISDELVKEFLKESHVNVHELECLSPDGSWNKSYRMIVECNDINDIVNPEFRPDGIGCHHFWRKKELLTDIMEVQPLEHNKLNLYSLNCESLDRSFNYINSMLSGNDSDILCRQEICLIEQMQHKLNNMHND